MEVAPTPENIRRATRVRIRPAASKADPFNLHWGGIFMWFDLINGEHMSVALALQKLELQYPCPPARRKEYPLLFDPEAAPADVPKPVTRAWLTARFGLLMVAALGDEAAALRSWHSWRVTLACALRAAVDAEHPDGRPLDLIKVFGRWRSDDAVKIYGRLRNDEYARHVSASLRADAGSLEAAHEAAAMEHIDPVAVFNQVAAAAAEDSPAPPPEAPPPSPPPKRAKQGRTAAPKGTPASAKGRRKSGRSQPLSPTPREAAAQGISHTRPSAPATNAPRSRRRANPRPAPHPVLVPAACFPREICEENEGRGWSAVATPAIAGKVLVTFTRARDDAGRLFASIAMKSSALTYL